MSLYGYGLT
jgi:hypothetical protein